MCVTCGCKKYEDDHGDPRNITLSRLRQSAEVAEIGLPEVVRNIEEAVPSGGAGLEGGADIDPMSHGNTAPDMPQR
jgi:hypothetical protein